MSSASRAWIVATSIGVVEALKDQGVCRWNTALRSIQQHTKANLRSYSQAKKIPVSQCSSAVSNKLKDEKLKQSEESLRTVMYLSCWGPNNWGFYWFLYIFFPFFCSEIYMIKIILYYSVYISFTRYNYKLWIRLMKIYTLLNDCRIWSQNLQQIYHCWGKKRKRKKGVYMIWGTYQILLI